RHADRPPLGARHEAAPAHRPRRRRRLPGHRGHRHVARRPRQPAARRPRGARGHARRPRRRARAVGSRGGEAGPDRRGAAPAADLPGGVRRRERGVRAAPRDDRPGRRARPDRRGRPARGRRRDPARRPARRRGGGRAAGPAARHGLAVGAHGIAGSAGHDGGGRAARGRTRRAAGRRAGGRGMTRVWTPRAARVDLVLPGAGTTEPLTAVGAGWWAAGRDLPPGTDSAFSLAGGPARPDPRSPWHPAGVHGPSRTFDTAAHRWSDADWRGRDVRGAVVYELHVGTFTPEGTLDAAAGRLDHLADLGVDMVELMPLAAFGGRHGWGYDGVALWAVHGPYGGPAALQRFVDAAHVRGIAVCLDVVDNHLGPSGNYLAEFGPYFTDRHQTPWGAAVNLDGEGSEQVRAFVVEKALRWFRDFHVDALRLDAVHALVDDSPRHLLAELSDAVAALAADVGRPLSLVAESDANDPRTVTP